MGRPIKDKHINKAFTTGEEGILEDACRILERRKTDFISQYFRYGKVLKLIDTTPEK